MASPLEADDARRVADFEARLDPSDAAGAALLGEMKAELRRLQDARRHEDPRLSFSTPEFKEAQRAFTDAFKVHCTASAWLFWMQGAAEAVLGRVWRARFGFCAAGAVCGARCRGGCSALHTPDVALLHPALLPTTPLHSTHRRRRRRRAAAARRRRAAQLWPPGRVGARQRGEGRLPGGRAARDKGRGAGGRDESLLPPPPPPLHARTRRQRTLMPPSLIRPPPI